MICPQCGNDISEGEAFCTECGAPLEAELSAMFEPPRDDYGETEPYFTVAVKRHERMRQSAEPHRKSRVPYLIVSFLTALLSVLCFVLPYQEWVSYRYSLLGFHLSEGELSFSELAKRFYESKGLVSLVMGFENEGLEEMIPESAVQEYAEGRLVALTLAVIMLAALVLYVLFILSVLLRLRGVAATFGILASLVYGGVAIGVMVAVKRLRLFVERGAIQAARCALSCIGARCRDPAAVHCVCRSRHRHSAQVNNPLCSVRTVIRQIIS